MSKPLGDRKAILLRLPVELSECLDDLAAARRLKSNDLLTRLLQAAWDSAPEKPELVRMRARLAKLQAGQPGDSDQLHQLAAKTDEVAPVIALASQESTETRVCPVCRKTFEVPRKGQGKKFCSNACRYKAAKSKA